MGVSITCVARQIEGIRPRIRVVVSSPAKRAAGLVIHSRIGVIRPDCQPVEAAIGQRLRRSQRKRIPTARWVSGHGRAAQEPIAVTVDCALVMAGDGCDLGVHDAHLHIRCGHKPTGVDPRAVIPDSVSACPLVRVADRAAADFLIHLRHVHQPLAGKPITDVFYAIRAVQWIKTLLDLAPIRSAIAIGIALDGRCAVYEHFSRIRQLVAIAVDVAPAHQIESSKNGIDSAATTGVIVYPLYGRMSR